MQHLNRDTCSLLMTMILRVLQKVEQSYTFSVLLLFCLLSPIERKSLLWNGGLFEQGVGISTQKLDCDESIQETWTKPARHIITEASAHNNPKHLPQAVKLKAEESVVICTLSKLII